MATGLMFACGLATTLSVAIRCNTAIRLESVCCALVACGVKYVCLLVTTLGVVVHCNTTIKLESINYANDLWTGVFLLLSNNPQHCYPLRHSLQTEVCPLRAGNYQTFTLLPCLLEIKVGLSPWIEVCMPSTCSHQYVPRPLPFCCFPLREMYNLNIQVVN